jgi:hypothetical protein
MSDACELEIKLRLDPKDIDDFVDAVALSFDRPRGHCD